MAGEGFPINISSDGNSSSTVSGTGPGLGGRRCLGGRGGVYKPKVLICGLKWSVTTGD